MKTKDFVRILKDLGFVFIRSGRHEVWGKGDKVVAVPFGKEMNKMVARRLLKELNYG